MYNLNIVCIILTRARKIYARAVIAVNEGEELNVHAPNDILCTIIANVMYDIKIEKWKKRSL